MTINYTTLLGLTEPVTGTQSGTWGSDINTGLTDYVEAAIAGAQVISGSQTAVTLSVTTGSSSAPTTLSQAGSGATGSSQYQIIRCTGNPAGLLTITAPASDKTYVILNATSTSQSVKIVGAGPTTGVTIVSGERAFVAWNGSDFVKVGGAAGGSNTQVQYNNNGVFGGVSGATTNGTAITFSTTNLKLQGSSTGVSSFASANSSASDYTYTFPAASTTIPVATQTLTFSGPTAARTITLPDANFTAARTDAAQTFTGAQTFNTAIATGSGGTGLSLYTAGDMVYYSTGTTLTKLTIGAANRVMTSSGSAPQWVDSLTGLSSVSSTAFTENGYPVVSQADIGTAPNEIPLNQYLGDLAYQDSAAVTVGSLTASGNIILSTAGAGIDFSATANSSGTMTSELLSDYEEGTFTPNLKFGGGTTGITYTARSGKYIKVGNQVTVLIYFLLSNKGSSTGSATIADLPFTNGNGAGFEGATFAVNYWGGLIASIIPLGYVQSNTASIALQNGTASTAASVISDTSFSNSSVMYGIATYFVV